MTAVHAPTAEESRTRVRSFALDALRSPLRWVLAAGTALRSGRRSPPTAAGAA